MENNVEEMDGDDDNEEDPLGFPIQETDINVHMKNIHPSICPKFKGIDQKTWKPFFSNLKYCVDLMDTHCTFTN